MKAENHLPKIARPNSRRRTASRARRLGRSLALPGVFAAAVLASLSARAQNTNIFELVDGDRVVFLGDTFIEREQRYGWLEFVLTTHFPDRNVTFRNLGWSADTPSGISRAGFDAPEKGFDRIKEMIAFTKPTVVFLGYGMANSFDGDPGLPKFTNEVNRLLDTIQEVSGATNKVRLVIFSPLRHEQLRGGLPSPTNHNAQLAAYSKALHGIAVQRDAWFVPLFDRMNARTLSSPSIPITDDGIHLTSYGYRRIAETMMVVFRWPPHWWRWGVLQDGSPRGGALGAKVLSSEKKDDYLRMESVEEFLAWPPWRHSETNWPHGTPDSRLQVFGAKEGIYELKVDGKFVKHVTMADVAGGLFYDSGPQVEQATKLLEAIKHKNELFFHRWRPQNNTYLFLFRKHEQGQNAKEIPRFDPLVEEQEKLIATLRKPVQHVTELVWKGVADKLPAPPPPEKETNAPSAAPATAKALPLPKLDIEPGLEISLWAENPLLAKPIQMNFDSQGRLWVASSSVYPQIQPGQVADDKILILEDTDNDGKADKTTVFADGLLIPTGVEPGDGGAYVGHSTELLHLKDTDNDGKADQRRVVLSSFGTEDTHHILHTLRWGQDGQLYMCQSIYIHSHMETPHGVVRLNSGGTLSLRPSTMEVGILMKGLVNQWGHHMDPYGQSFATDGAGGMPPNGIFYVLPGGMYSTYAGARRTLGSVSPASYPKFCGLEIVHSEHFPAEWQGSMITCDFRANRVVRFSVQEQGSAYGTKEMPDMIRTKDVTFRPIDVKMGPDGAIYIADWSNPIIQHGEVDFRDPRRDHEHGRIWRVTFKGRPLVKKPQLDKTANTELLEQLLSANGFNREKARRVLLERGTNILADLGQWLPAHGSDERAQLEALWLYQGVDIVESALLEKLLEAQDGKVRAAAVRVLSQWTERQPPAVKGLAATSVGWPPAPQPLAHRAEISAARAIDLLAKRIADDHPRVRLETVRALARIPSGWSAVLALKVLEKPMDEFLDYAAWLTINDLAEPWIAAIEAGISQADERQLQFGLKAIEPALATRVLTRLVKQIPSNGAGAGIELIGYAGDAQMLRRLVDQLAKGGFDDAAALRALKALTEASHSRKVKPSGDLAVIDKWLDAGSVDIRAAAARLAGEWKIKSAAPTLLKLAKSDSVPMPLRLAAIEALRDLGGEDVVAGLRELTSAGQDAALRRYAALALAGVDLKGSAKPILDVVASTTNNEDALALWRALLTTKGAASAIAKALPSSFPETPAKAGLRAAREGGRAEPELILALSKASGVSNETQNLTDAEIKKIAAMVKDASPARGEMVYRRKELGCILCHSIGGAGGKVGPDLTSLGAGSQMDYIVESVLAPDRKVKEGFHSIQLTTKDGQELSGVQVRDNKDEVILRDATNKEISIPKKNIESQHIGGSIMPAALVDALSQAERLDLFRFLSELGKPGPFDATKGTVARVWRCNTSSTGDGDAAVLKTDFTSPEWQPVYSTVGGDLPRKDIERELTLDGRKEVFFAAARFNVAKGGAVTLRLSGVNSPKAWIDGKPVGGSNEMRSELPAGNHVFVLKLDPRQLPESLRLESSEATFLVD